MKVQDLIAVSLLPPWTDDEVVVCDAAGCDVRCTPANWHHLQVLICGDVVDGLGRGRRTLRGRRFCSQACLTRYWQGGPADPFFEGLQIVTPDEAQSVPCPKCASEARDACAVCNSTGLLYETPAFFFAYPGITAWRSEWAARPDFERDLAVYVFEAGPGEAITELTDDVVRFREDRLVEGWLFPTPVQLVAWWDAAITAADHARVRAEFRAFLDRRAAHAA